MKIIEVNNSSLIQKFHDFPKKLYKDDQNWTCPLDIEIENIFSPEANNKFKNGEAIRWILEDENKTVVGRIAAFYDKQLMTHFRYPTGGCGFFECIDDENAAFMLFDTAKDWLIAKGMKAMQGPINFGENFNYWGLLVKGFVKQSYALPYNYPYYQKLFENYGFQNYFEQYSYYKKVNGEWPDRIIKFAEHTEQTAGYEFKHFNFVQIDEFVSYFVEIYNKIWSTFHDNYSPLNPDDIRNMLTESKLVLDDELIWFAFDKGKPIGFIAATPDVNQILAKLKNGKLNLINKLKFFYFRKRAVNRVRVFVGGAHPDYQNKMVAGMLYLKLLEVLRKRGGYEEIEMGWVGDFNKKMQATYRVINAISNKTHITYLKLFDDSIKFERFVNEFEGKLYEYKKKDI